MSQQLFIAVATGQNVSNMPPILQFAHRGDIVLWLESSLAAQQGWADGAKLVLKARGLVNAQQSIDGDINSPLAIQNTVQSWLNQHQPNMTTLYIVLNGGQKLTAFGLALAGRIWRDERKRSLLFLYGDDRPAQLQVYRERIGSQPEMLTYDASRMLSLKEVLQVNGFELQNQPEVIDWRVTQKKVRYGADLAFTRIVHKYAIQAEDTQQKVCDWPPFQHWAKKSKNQFQERLEKLFERFGIYVAHKGKRADDFHTSLAKIVRDFHPKKPKSSIQADDRKQLQAEGWVVNDMVIMGENFERVVANRLARYLADNPKASSIVRECKLNTKTQGAEWDVVVVLVNGIVLNLECKSWQAEKKDLDARFRMLRSASGRLARMSVVMPLFESMDEPIDEKMRSNYEHVKNMLGVSVLPLTMLCNIPSDELSFEAGLDQLFKPYIV